jgi:hypothetical protein
MQKKLWLETVNYIGDYAMNGLSDKNKAVTDTAQQI